jgi:hypothetical protein
MLGAQTIRVPAERDWAPDARRLLLEVVETFEKLEVVCALHGARAPRPVAALARELGLSSESVAEAARDLRGARVLCEDGHGWRIDPASPWFSQVDALAYGYEHDRIAVFNLMTKLALERIRSSAAQTFADAFLLRPRKKEDDGDA